VLIFEVVLVWNRFLMRNLGKTNHPKYLQVKHTLKSYVGLIMVKESIEIYKRMNQKERNIF